MRTLLLLRHATSRGAFTGPEDFDKPLSKRGVRAAGRVAAFLAAEGAAPDLILCTAARRGVDTLAQLLPALPRELRISIEKSLYMATAPRLLSRLRRVDESVGTVLVIGHNPGLQRLAVSLAGGGEEAGIAAVRADFPPAGLAVVRLPDKPWSRLAPGDGTLAAFVTPSEAGRRRAR